MELIEGVSLSRLCDYSFGDQSGKCGCDIYTSFMKDANVSNLEFYNKVQEIKKERDYMTLFIDNIRLYKRDIKDVKPQDKSYVNSLMAKSDLLKLCSHFSNMRFIIFTNLEDTSIDEYIHDLIPENVLCISAVNAVAHGGKVIAAPYGVQRRLHPNDNRIENIKKLMENTPPVKKLLYVSHNDGTHHERIGIKDLFVNKSWASVNYNRADHLTFMKNICEHKFTICPRGNAVDGGHRNYEVLYVRRVPVMKRHPYLEELYKDYPVLFVDNFTDITEQLLIDNENLYEEAQIMDLSKWTLPNYYDTIVNEYK